MAKTEIERYCAGMSEAERNEDVAWSELGGVTRRSVLKCEQLTTLPKSMLDPAPLGGPLSRPLMVEVEKAILVV